MNAARLFLLLLAFPVLSPCGAQTPPAPANMLQPPAAKPYTLADALSGSSPSPGVVLAVGAAERRLPPDTTSPKTGATLNQIAAAFGLIARRFGSVTALAPPTMTLINADPKNPDLFQDLDDGDKFKIFAASLTQTQWQALTSERGIGLSDLSDSRQRAMFSALFPKRLSARPRPFVGQYLDAQDLTSDLPLARLRFGQKMDLMAPTTDHSNLSLENFYKPDGPPEYIIDSDRTPDDTSTDVRRPRP